MSVSGKHHVVSTSLAGLALLLIAGAALRGYDIRVLPAIPTQPPVSVLSVTFPGGTPITRLRLGGRVGNWRKEDGSIIFDLSVGTGTAFHLTDIYTLPSNGGSATWISNNAAGGWVAGDPAVQLPATGSPPNVVYVGNAWTCPGNEYTLFQASESFSNAGGAAGPGSGVDNNVWVYRAFSKKIWKITNYPVGVGQGVLGPQCSEDSISMTNNTPIHIVFGHLLSPPSPVCGTGSTGGPSDGTCQWFGDWEVVFADLNRDASTLDPTNASGNYLSNIVHDKPRDSAANPIAYTTGTGSIMAGLRILTSPVSVFTMAMVGSAVTIPGAGPMGATLNTSALTYLSATSVKVATAASTSVTTQPFTVQNKVYYEPHRYVTNLGDFYFSSNRRITTHDSVGVLWNHSTQYFQEYAPTEPAPGTCPGFQDTWFNEFFTPNPSNQHAVFMSDRATACTNLTLVPEYADRYMCTMPGCTGLVRLSYFNTFGNLEYHGDGINSYSVSYVTASRGAWSPDGKQYIAMDEYGTAGDTDVHGQLTKFTFRYPATEVSGSAVMHHAVTH